MGSQVQIPADLQPNLNDLFYWSDVLVIMVETIGVLDFLNELCRGHVTSLINSSIKCT